MASTLERFWSDGSLTSKLTRQSQPAGPSVSPPHSQTAVIFWLQADPECLAKHDSGGKEKPLKEIQGEIRALIRQITACVTFLPLLDEPCACAPPHTSTAAQFYNTATASTHVARLVVMMMMMMMQAPLICWCTLMQRLRYPRLGRSQTPSTFPNPQRSGCAPSQPRFVFPPPSFPRPSRTHLAHYVLSHTTRAHAPTARCTKWTPWWHTRLRTTTCSVSQSTMIEGEPP